MEGAVPEAEEGEDEELEPDLVQRNAEKDEDLDLDTAMALATTIKSTAAKLFSHGNILGDLAVRLDDAADSVFGLLRQQQEAANAKVLAEKAKLVATQNKKNNNRAASAVDVGVADLGVEPTTLPDTEIPPLPEDLGADVAMDVIATV